MANISKIKRDRMIAFLDELKKTHGDDASIRAFNEIENFLNEKKFGLVWEEHTEQVDEMLESSIPVFTEDKARRVLEKANLPYNFILEGDNLQSLYLLEKTHKGNVDCIYIDPPYNTGAKDWKYNNDYVDKTNVYRHSKWLSMMNVRLELAKKLLKDDGVLICAIDENELGTTLLLLEDVFGQNYSIDPITIVHNPRGVQGDNFSYVNEFAIFVYKKGYKVIENCSVADEDIDWRDLRDNGHESLRMDAATCFYAINVTPDGTIVGFGPNMTHELDFHPHRNVFNDDGTISIYPIDIQGIERKWRYNTESVVNIQHLLRVKKINGIYDIELGKNYAPYRTVWVDKKYDSNEYGTQLINAMVPKNDFSFPKSVYNTYECLRAVTLYRPNAIIVDFFAGSGTTGHATLLLNAELGGNRRFILCTNNEVGEKKEKEFKSTHGEIDIASDEWKEFCEKYGIASSVTYPRLVAAIKGFIHNKDVKETLFEQKITPTVFKKANKTIENAEEIISANNEKYDEIKWVIEDNILKIIGITKKGNHVAGIPANLKYFKCDWTPRKPEGYLLSNVLCLHIKEMIELQTAQEVDGVKNVLILNRDDFNKHILDAETFKKVENIWLNQNMVLSVEEMRLLAQKGFKYIPREYFGQELREAAE